MRTRQRGSIRAPGSVEIGIQDYDFSYPYGDGPWLYPYTVYDTTYTPLPIQEEKCVDELHAGPPFRTGGPFDKFEFFTDRFEIKKRTTLKSGMYRYRGGFLPSLNPCDFLSYSSLEGFINSNTGDVSDYGAAGWNKFRPTNSGAQIGVALGEIREIPRMLRTTAKGFHDLWRSMGGNLKSFGPKNVANHWLNTQFGWFPFLSDLRDFYDITKNLDTRLKQLRRDNGRWIRRGGTVRKSAETEVVLNDSTTVGFWPSLAPGLYAGSPPGSRMVTRLNEQRIWFRGAFRYWIPGKPDSWQWRARAVAQLYGLQPSPSLLWELTPWSWLIDWCADAGDAIANLSSILFDNLCAKYAYVMGTTAQTVTFYGRINSVNGPMSESWTASLVRKSRVPASPFGFGLTGGDFSARQWSILSALGLTRMGR